MTKIDLLQGTLDHLVLRMLTREEMRAADGRKQFEAEERDWEQLSSIIAEVLQKE